MIRNRTCGPEHESHSQREGEAARRAVAGRAAGLAGIRQNAGRTPGGAARMYSAVSSRSPLESLMPIIPGTLATGAVQHNCGLIEVMQAAAKRAGVSLDADLLAGVDFNGRASAAG